jgi:hypothetical protein
MKRVFLSLLSASALAQEPAAPATTPAPADATPPAPEAKVEPYQVKTRSTFELQSDARPPFWPIGWQRRSADVAVPVKKGEMPVAPKLQVLLPEYFTVTGVFLGSPALATINGRSFAEGETIPIIFDGKAVKLRLRTVRDGGVTLETDQQSFFVPLRRAEVPKPAGGTQELSTPPVIIIDSGPKKK